MFKIKTLFVLFFGILTSFCLTQYVSAATADHLVISEVQVAGVTADDEFIEIYNPTTSPINLELLPLKLHIRNSSGTDQNRALTFVNNKIIPAHGYFLIGPASGYSGSASLDATYSVSGSKLVAKGGAYISKSITVEADIIDKVGWETQPSPGFETAPFAASPAAGQSMERGLGGDLGNGEDTDNNSVDFVLSTTPTPQNTASTPKPVITTPPPPDNQNPPPPDTQNNLPPTASEPPAYTPLFGDIVINEFVSDPADGEEWVELYNRIGKEMDLSGWTIEEGSESITPVEGKLGADLSGRFLVISPIKGNLNNAGDTILLKNASGQVIDQVAYGNWSDGNLDDNAPKASDPNSIARLSDGANTFNNANDFQITSVLTKGAPNVISTAEAGQTAAAATNYSRNIIINEFLPNPIGSDNDMEFIELKNAGSQAIDLAGWKLGDSGAKKYTIKKESLPNTVINGNDFLVFYRQATGIALNNTGGDAVRLYDPNNQLLETVEYQDSAKENQTYARDQNNNWNWTTEMTPAKENIIAIPNQAPKAVIDALKKSTIGEEITFDASDSSDPDNEAITYLWNFGDGATETLVNPIHIYKQPGIYKVVLTVADPKEAKDTAEINLTIKDTAEAKIIAPQEISNSDIYINEFLPNPVGPDEGEWIELKNSGQTNLDLAGWKIDDGDGGSSPYALPQGSVIAPQGFLLLKRVDTKIALNNTFDSVRLFNPEENLVSQVDFEEVKEGLSYALGNDGQWAWTEILTPREENILAAAEENPATVKSSKKEKAVVDTTLEKVREEDLGTIVRLSGRVAVEPGVLGKTIFYLAGSGIQVYFSKSDWPKLQLGNLIQVTGTLGQSSEETRIKLANKDDIQFLAAGAPPEPKEIIDEEINEDLEGYLVKVAGEVTDKKGQTIYLDTGTQEISVYLKASANIPKPKIEEGDQLSVTGIVSQTKSGYRLLPRYAEDLKIIAPAVAAESGVEKTTIGGNTLKGDIIKYLSATAGTLMLVLGGLMLKKRKAGQTKA